MTRRGDALVVGGLLAPWAVAALLLPLPLRLATWALFLTLALLSLVAASWSRARAQMLGLDGERWATAAAMTLGLSSFMLLGSPSPSAGPTFLCGECGRLGSLHEPFCFGCGS